MSEHDIQRVETPEVTPTEKENSPPSLTPVPSPLQARQQARSLLRELGLAGSASRNERYQTLLEHLAGRVRVLPRADGDAAVAWRPRNGLVDVEYCPSADPARDQCSVLTAAFQALHLPDPIDAYVAADWDSSACMLLLWQRQAFGEAFAREFLGIPNTVASGLWWAKRYGEMARRLLELPRDYRPTLADAWRLAGQFSDRLQVFHADCGVSYLQQFGDGTVLLNITTDVPEGLTEESHVVGGIAFGILSADGWLPRRDREGYERFTDAFRSTWEGCEDE